MLWSAQDAVESGFETIVLWDLTRAVDPGSDDRIRTSMAGRGVRVVAAEQLHR